MIDLETNLAGLEVQNRVGSSQVKNGVKDYRKVWKCRRLTKKNPGCVRDNNIYIFLRNTIENLERTHKASGFERRF